MTSYKELTHILDSIGFSEFYIHSISNLERRVDFGTRKGTIDFLSIKSAAEQYTYEPTGEYMVHIDNQLDSPQNLEASELILQCIEVFDWGGVQSSNIIKAINLHRGQALKKYLIECKAWFEDDTTLTVDIEDVVWSSGWTKVYSFMFGLTTIYDSRVAAYINYIFSTFYDSLAEENDKRALKSITQYFVSFKGPVTRTRCLNSDYRTSLRIKMKSSSDSRNFVANKVASWVLRYLCQLEYGDVNQEHFRQLDKAMFMLGFDIAQIEIDSDARFE